MSKTDAPVGIPDAATDAAAQVERDRFFALSLDLLCIAGPDGYFKRTNAAFGVLGYTPEELTTQPFVDFVHPDDVSATLAEAEKLGQGIPTIRFENRYRCKDGSYRWLLWSASPDHDGLVYCAARDVTEQKRAEDALRTSDQEFRSLAESMPQIVWATRADGWNIYFNQQWVAYTGLTLEQSYGHGWNAPFHPDDRQRAWTAWQRATRDHAPYALECRLRRADGAYHWWLVRGVPFRDANGEILKWFGTCTDIDDAKSAELALREVALKLERSNRELEKSQQEFRDMIEKLPACIMIRRGDVLVYVNPATAAATGYEKPSELVGMKLVAFIHPSSHELLQQRLSGTLPPSERELRVFRADGTTILIETAAEPTSITFEGAPAILTSFRDITEEKRAKTASKEHAKRMETLSLSDELTQLNNRRGFLALGEQQLKMASRTRHPAVVLFIDIDGLKAINDQLGHEVGDAAITVTAKILRSTFRNVDILARLGGDEFVTMIVNCPDPRVPVLRLMAGLDTYNRDVGSRFRLSVSTGAAVFNPAAPESVAELMERADTAMYQQKRSRRTPALLDS